MTLQRRSAAEADKASTKRWLIGGGIAIFIIMILVYTGIIQNDLHRFFLVTKSFTKWLGLVAFAAAFFMLYKADRLATSWHYIGMALLLVALGIALACGFDFSYFRLK